MVALLNDQFSEQEMNDFGMSPTYQPPKPAVLPSIIISQRYTRAGNGLVRILCPTCEYVNTHNVKGLTNAKQCDCGRFGCYGYEIVEDTLPDSFYAYGRR